MKKMLFIYNPNSGRELLKPKLSDVLDIFVKGGYDVTVYPTQKYHDAIERIKSYTEHYDLVVCSGGGGTRVGTRGVQALAEGVAGTGGSDAARAVLNSQDSSSGRSSASSGSVSEVFSGAASSIQSGFDLQIYETVLLILGAVALLVLLLSIVMLIRRR